MDRTVAIFSSHEDADAADRTYYASLTPQQRLDLQLELIRRYRESLGEPGDDVREFVELLNSTDVES